MDCGRCFAVVPNDVFRILGRDGDGKGERARERDGLVMAVSVVLDVVLVVFILLFNVMVGGSVV